MTTRSARKAAACESRRCPRLRCRTTGVVPPRARRDGPGSARYLPPAPGRALRGVRVDDQHLDHTASQQWQGIRKRPGRPRARAFHPTGCAGPHECRCRGGGSTMTGLPRRQDEGLTQARGAGRLARGVLGGHHPQVASARCTSVPLSARPRSGGRLSGALPWPVTACT